MKRRLVSMHKIQAKAAPKSFGAWRTGQKPMFRLSRRLSPRDKDASIRRWAACSACPPWREKAFGVGGLLAFNVSLVGRSRPGWPCAVSKIGELMCLIRRKSGSALSRAASF
jgi:hypothetical protein